MIDQKWCCLDCRGPVELNVSGRCGVCDSDAVDMMAETDARLEALPVLPPSVSNENAQPLFMRLGAFLRFGNSSSASVLSSLVRPTSYSSLQVKDTTNDSASVN